MICNIHATVGHNVRPGHHIRMCFNPLEIYAMSFRSFPTSYDPYWPFSMFLCYSRCLLVYIWLIATSMDYLHVPHTVVYLFNVFPTLSALLRPFVDFIYLCTYRYSDVLIIYIFGWLRYYYRFGLWSLRTISHIRSLRRHFDLSEVIFTYILPTTPITHRITSYLIPSPS